MQELLFVKDYKNNEELRSFNELATKTFGILMRLG